MKILVPGGCGYVGALLVPQLLADGHKVRVYDTQWFGDGSLPDNGSLEVLKADIRDLENFKEACRDIEAVIFLASLSNNAMSEVNYPVFNEVNGVAAGECMKDAKAAGVRRFIYASSVAGYSTGDRWATEEDNIYPHTHYSLTKKACEEMLKVLRSDDFETVVTRAATVCGYSPHMRFDTTVHKMINDAWNKGIITVNGGEQYRAHVHIKDLCAFYRHLLKNPNVSGVFNVCSENQRVVDTAQLVVKVLRDFKATPMINVSPATDNRSYSVDSAKLASVGFECKWPIEAAIMEVAARFSAGQWKDSYNDAKQNIATGLK